MKQVKLLFIITLLSITATHSWAINLATWTFTNASGDWGPGTKAPATSTDSLTIVGLTRGSGLTTSGTAAGSAWGGTGFFDGTLAGSQTATTAITNNNFITFSFTADAGFGLSLSQISAYNIRRSSTGPGSMIWQYSLDGTNFTDIGTTISIGSNTTNVGNAKPAIALTGITALQNVPSGTTVTLRAVMWGSSNDGGTWYLNGNAGGTFGVSGEITSTPLALDLISFKGQSENHVNQLNWVTANERNVARFELQRGMNGQRFEKIAAINAKGNDKDINNNYYAFKDETAPATAFYRLLMIDINGKTTYSDVVVLRNNDATHSVRIYPNPATTTLFLEGSGSTSFYSITDVAGRNVVPSTFINAESTLTSIDISGLRQGLYFLQLSDNDRKEIIRFIKK